jgi:hypothetical protein
MPLGGRRSGLTGAPRGIVLHFLGVYFFGIAEPTMLRRF